MLKLATRPADQYWGGDQLELNFSFGNLRDYQWKRLLNGLWNYSGMTGPFADRYIPRQTEPEGVEIRLPDPTATLSQYGAYELAPNVRVGIEILCTRSLFECVSLLIPLAMFEDLPHDPQNPDFQALERTLYDLALYCFKITPFDIAVLGVNRECQLLVEMLDSPSLREQFFKTGNFLAQDESILALKGDPKSFARVLPTLRWAPRPQ
jgi:hypothetical protein